jgi:hypothetical protein
MKLPPKLSGGQFLGFSLCLPERCQADDQAGEGFDEHDAHQYFMIHGLELLPCAASRVFSVSRGFIRHWGVFFLLSFGVSL